MNKLTEKQKAFCDYYIESLNATESWEKAFNNFYGFKNLNLIKNEDPIGIIIESICVLEDEEIDVIRKYAATVLLKILLNKEFRKILLDNPELYPIDRNDYRVIAWRKKILEKGYCEKCGSSKNLEAHHIIHWSDYPKGRIDYNNGMCLCKKCHAEEHKEESVYNMMRRRIK